MPLDGFQMPFREQLLSAAEQRLTEEKEANGPNGRLSKDEALYTLALLSLGDRKSNDLNPRKADKTWITIASVSCLTISHPATYRLGQSATLPTVVAPAG